MQQREFIRGLLAGDQHRNGIRCLRFFSISESAFSTLSEEVGSYQQVNLASQVTDTAHVTHWTNPKGQVEQYSMLNASGRSDDFGDDHNLSCDGKWFFDQHRYPTLANLVTDWPHLINFRINVLRPGAALGAHEEHVPFRTNDGAVGARLRFHLPIQTSSGAELVLDGLVYQLQPGFIYLVNQGCVHSAVNEGTDPRVHLVWDALLTAELFAWLFGPADLPNYLQPVANVEPAPVRTQKIGARRRLPLPLTANEASTMTLCAPQ